MFIVTSEKNYLPCRKSGEPSSLEENRLPALLQNEKECDTCIICNKLVTDDSFECVWCRKWQHRVCVSLSVGQSSALSDLPNNIVFFFSQCIYKLPNALMAYDNSKEMCDVIDTKLNSVQMELSNRFEDLTEKVNNLVAYSEQEPETAMVVEDAQPSEQVINKKQVIVESIAKMTAAIVSEEKEREKWKLNLIVHNFPESTLRPVFERTKIHRMLHR